MEVLASSLVANFLLPYVKDGLKAIARKVGEATSEAAGEQAASLTKRVWDRVRRLFDDHPDGGQVLHDFEADPDTTAAYLKVPLARLLEADPEAAKELLAFTEARAPGSDETIATVMRNSGVTITVVGSTLTHSPITGISHAASPPRPPNPGA